MNLERLFDSGRNNGQAVLIGYLPAGFPDPEKFHSILFSLASAGLRCVEIGIPAKQPALDGRVISAALERVLEQGVTFEQALSVSGKALCRSDLTGVAMIYHATLLEVGVGKVLSGLHRHHFEAVLVPDLPPEQYTDFARRAAGAKLKPVGFVSAGMRDEQIERIASSAQGFLYLQAYEGSTGNRIRLDSQTVGRLKRVKELAGRRRLPVAVGFGIRTPEEARRLQKEGAEGIIVGTALVEAAAESRDRARGFILEILRALSGET
jgi:tryptophan synthase alpha chain